MTDFDLAMLRLDVDALTEWDIRFALIVFGEMLEDRRRDHLTQAEMLDE